jgi:hypothetical protein
MVNIAICYFGMTRSLKKVYKSHINNIFNILIKNNICFDIYMHSWKTDKNIIWGNISHIPIDYEEYKLLNPNYYQLDIQLEFLKSLNFSNYFNEALYKKYGGDTKHEWRPELIRNHLCALESQKRVTDMVLNTEKKYDYVMYIRPDVEINTLFSPLYLNIKLNEIAIPNYDHHEGYNDRFAIVPFEKCSLYGKRINEIIDFRKNHGRIVSEKYVKFILLKYFSKINFIDFKFTIVRP